MAPTSSPAPQGRAMGLGGIRSSSSASLVTVPRITMGAIPRSTGPLATAASATCSQITTGFAELHESGEIPLDGMRRNPGPWATGRRAKRLWTPISAGAEEYRPAHPAEGDRPAGFHGDLPERHAPECPERVENEIGLAARGAARGDEHIGAATGPPRRCSRRPSSTSCTTPVSMASAPSLVSTP